MKNVINIDKFVFDNQYISVIVVTKENKMEKTEKIYSILEIAKKFNVTYLTISRLIHSGKLKAFKIAGAYRVYENDLNEYIKNTRISK